MTVTPTPPVGPWPTAPSRQRPTVFAAEMDAFLAALVERSDDLEAVAEAAEANAQAGEDAAEGAEGSAAAAAASAATALNAPGTQATSVTELTIGTGPQSFDLEQLGKAFPLFQRVKLAHSADAYMIGDITAFVSGTGAMTVEVTEIVGSGTYTSWGVAPTGAAALPAATAAQVRAGTASGVAVSPLAQSEAVEFGVLTDAATVAWNVAEIGPNARVTLGGNRTIGAPSNLLDGVTYTLNIDPATYTPAWASIWDFGAQGAPSLPASVISKVTAQYDATAGKLQAGVWLGAA